MIRRWGQDRPYDWAAEEYPEWLKAVMAGAAVLVFVAAVATLGILLFGAPAGAETLEQDCARPYHNLTAEQLPNICTVQFDGQGHATLAGYNPDSGLIWHAATFHIANPDNWPDQTVTVDTTLPAGPFNLTLACEAGAAQVDVWLEGHDDAYVAATTLDCDTPCYLNIAVSVPDTAPSVEQHDDAPCGTATPAAGAPSGTTGPDLSNPVLSAATNTTPTTPPPVGVASSAAETTIAPPTVVSAAAATTLDALPNTGVDIRWLLLAATASLVAAMVLILVGPHIFRNKGRRP